MDKFLSREESLELMDLLQIPRHCYGNFALMKINHKKMSLKYHPDKGGDPEKMSRLNQLWQKLQEGIYNARQEFPTSFSSQVGSWYWEANLISLKEYFGKKKYDENVIKHWPQCAEKALKECKCLTCKIGLQHFVYKQMHQKKCVVWGECFCYKCYCAWFGEDLYCLDSLWAWSCIVGEVDFHLVNLYLRVNQGFNWVFPFSMMFQPRMEEIYLPMGTPPGPAGGKASIKNGTTCLTPCRTQTSSAMNPPFPLMNLDLQAPLRDPLLNLARRIQEEEELPRQRTPPAAPRAPSLPPPQSQKNLSMTLSLMIFLICCGLFFLMLSIVIKLYHLF
uniref:Middle T antigen n=1 Tax=Trichodysplasia spinulosa-associated polyomavirus TaxID=862909 RepID=A0A2P1E471_9POLY|nr:middle T antigen [Trichodysplasia spinulosa-associated polyomavirus]